MLKISEKIFAIAMLFYMTGAVFPFIAGYENRYSRLEGNPFELALELMFYAGAFCFIGLHWRTVINGAKNVKWIILLALIAISSAAWSQDPTFTFRRSIVLVATTVFGIYFGSRFTVPQQLRLLAWNCAFVVLFSFVIAILLPRYGIDHFQHPGDWQGAFTQKNMLARMMVLAFMVFYFARSSRWRYARWLGIVGAITLLALSRSVTGAIVFCAIAAVLAFYRLLRMHFTFAIPMVIGIALAAAGSVAIIMSSLADILRLVNRSPRLTGRTDLWDAVLSAITKRPWFGYGFNGFWQGMKGESASLLLTVRWPVLHSHNGFLDLLLDLGVFGLVVFAISYLVVLRRAIKLVKMVPGPNPAWLCTYLAFMFFYNFSESSILVENNIYWVLYTSTAVSLFLVAPRTFTTTEEAPEHGQ